METHSGSSGGTERTGDSTVDLLTDPHCRYLLRFLSDEDEPVTVATAAKHVVAGITDTETDEVSDDVQRRVQTWLHHGLLPKLDDRGIVEFDPESNTVEMTGSATV